MTAVDALPIELGLSPEDAQARFDELQAKLVPLWKSMDHMTQDEQTIVVVCSMTLDEQEMPATVTQAYEERFLFLLLLLRQPRARLVYVTSQAVNPSIVDYYLALLPGVIPSHARERLFLVSPLDGSPRPLSEKLLERPRLLERIRSLIPDPSRAHLVPFNTTERERDLAIALGIPMYGADPRFFDYGTKTGCRRLFAEQGVPHPARPRGPDVDRGGGRGDRRASCRAAWARAGDHQAERGRVGRGQRDRRPRRPAGRRGRRRRSSSGCEAMQFELPEITFDWYADTLSRRGGVVEERITGEEFRSPSVQMRVTPLGRLEVLSTHDQLLGGPSGQSYLGCIFPADPAYAAAITRARGEGRRAARERGRDRTLRDGLRRRPSSQTARGSSYAIELNLRKGGTTHPFLTLQFLTDGLYDPETAVFLAPSGRPKYFIASDHVENPAYRSLTPDDLFDIGVRRGLHFDQARQTGVVFHMMSALGEHGRTGLTAVGESPEEARALYDAAVATLDEEAAAALAERRLPDA